MPELTHTQIAARIRDALYEIEAHCSANRLDAPPWVASVRAILHRSEETADHA